MMLAGWIWLHGMVGLVCWLVGSCCCSYGWHPACRQRHEKCIACIIFPNHYGSIGKDQVESMIIGSCQHSTCIIGQLWFTMENAFMVGSSRFIAVLRCSIARTPCSQCHGSSVVKAIHNFHVVKATNEWSTFHNDAIDFHNCNTGHRQHCGKVRRVRCST